MSAHDSTGSRESNPASTVTVGQRARLSGWRAYVSDLWNRREFAWYLATGNLKARNASTTLGLFWWVLNPILMSLVYFVAFGIIFSGRRGETQFLSWLLSGMFAFTFTTTAMTSGANAIISNRKLLVNIRFPRLIFPITALIETAIGFLASLGIYYLLAWPTDGVRPTARLLVLPAVFALHLLFNLGLAAAVARLTVPFRDINNLLPHLTRMWLYLTPIIWPLSFFEEAPEALQTILRFNPMFSILSMYRYALMGRDLADGAVPMAIAWTVVLAIGGVLAFVRYEGNMVRHL